jgi:hypothetical protein
MQIQLPVAVKNIQDTVIIIADLPRLLKNLMPLLILASKKTLHGIKIIFHIGFHQFSIDPDIGGSLWYEWWQWG